MKLVFVPLLLAFAIVACGPSPEVLASQTSDAATAVADAWTSTPTDVPTHTPTPVPTNTITPTPTSTLEPGRHYEDEGSFSYIPPEGWVVDEFPGLKFKVVIGPIFMAFASNIVIVDEVFAGSLDEYFEVNLLSLEQFFVEFEILEQGDFVTDSGMPGKRLVFEDIQQGNILFQIQYYFWVVDRYIVVTCTRLAEAGEETDLLCDESMNSFRLES